MKHYDVDTNGRGEFHKRLLDNMVGARVCPDVIDAMWHNGSIRKSLEIMVVGFWSSFA